MSTVEYIYLACAIAGALIFLFRMIMMLAGGIGGGDGEVDGADFGDIGDADVGEFEFELDTGEEGAFGLDDTDASFNFLSIQGVSSFIMMFGIVGLAVARMAIPSIFSFIAGVAAGAFTVWVVSLIFKNMIRLQSDGTLKLQNAIGKTGTVYLRIPEGDEGKVSVVVQGALRVMNSVSNTESMIKTGEKVKIVEIRGTKLVVEPINQK
ncbi:MAG: NfeD family protein [Anaerolineaceae bacterium]|nr:NfeD family protein [Anaerolineaceae bacterium]